MAGLPGYLNGLTNHPHLNESIRQIAFDLLAAARIEAEQYTQAIQICEEIIETYPGTESDVAALFHLFTLYDHELADLEQAEATLADMTARFPDHFLTISAQLDWGDGTAALASAHFNGLAQPTAGVLGDGAETVDVPTVHRLEQNYPNPFNPTTVISFQLPVSSHVDLKVYNTTGQLVKTLLTADCQLGTHTVTWNGRNDSGLSVSSGVYYYRMETGSGYDETKRMMLLK